MCVGVKIRKKNQSFFFCIFCIWILTLLQNKNTNFSINKYIATAKGTFYDINNVWKAEVLAEEEDEEEEKVRVYYTSHIW